MNTILIVILLVLLVNTWGIVSLVERVRRPGALPRKSRTAPPMALSLSWVDQSTGGRRGKVLELPSFVLPKEGDLIHVMLDRTADGHGVPVGAYKVGFVAFEVEGDLLGASVHADRNEGSA
jgi:hypothetical protein